MEVVGVHLDGTVDGKVGTTLTVKWHIQQDLVRNSSEILHVKM